MTPAVEISTSGRGGTITYREGDHSLSFDWEFAESPALALIWGPPRGEWDARASWAISRQEAIFAFVGAEVVRQKAPDGAFECDVDSGQLTILSSKRSRTSRR